MRRWPNVGLLLGQRRGRWSDSKATLDQRLVFARKVQKNKLEITLFYYHWLLMLFLDTIQYNLFPIALN